MAFDNNPVPGNESERLSALRTYDILDTLPEKELDAITRLASYICQVPLAFISFIDEDRQWFKSAFGLDIQQVQRNESFCRFTLMNDFLVEVPDTTQNELFAHSDLVTGGMGIRFYASAPLIDIDGHRLGTLCVFDQKPKHLNDEQRDALKTLASEVISHLTLRKQKKELQASVTKHEEFFNLFSSSSEIHFIADREGKIIQINQSVETILGYPPQAAIGRSLWDFVVGQNRDQFAGLIEKGQLSQKSFELETATVTRDNKVKWISWSAINKDEKWYASGRDITYQKQLLSEMEQLSLVASKVSNGVAISNAADEVVWVNDAFEKITGYERTDVEHKLLRDVLKGELADPAQGKELDYLIKTHQPYEIELRVQKKNGPEVWLSIINSVILDTHGVVDKYIRVIIDITARKSAEQDLEILSFAARKSPSGIIIRDMEGRVMWMNEAGENIMGYDLDEIKGHTFANKMIGPDTDLSVFETALQAVKENRPYEVEIKIYTKEGLEKWIHISNSPLFNESGKLERQIAVVVDVSDRKEAEEQLKLLSLVASNTLSGVVINDGNGEVEWVNDAFEKITGYSLNNVHKRHLGDVLKGELTDYSIIQKARELSKNKQSFEVDLLIYRRDGQPIWISVINSVIINAAGAVDRYIEVIIDITAKKKAELELIAAKEEALQLSRAKDMFISVMSHEIRTPLNAVIGMSHLLMEDNPTESQKENLDVLKFSAENLMTLINDLLDFTKIETGNVVLEKTRVDLRELVQSVTSSMQYKATGKNITIKQTVDSTLPEWVTGDRTRLCQILLNLAGNAVKFTEKGAITIDLKVIEQSEKEVRVRFAVSDSGIGIANDKINTIFESFKQAELDTTRKYGGTGLGLAITKRLIELHDSRINVDSVLGQGSTFWFTITFKKADGQKTNNTNNVEIGLKINVLVVDDNQINRLLINKVLKKWGANADFAENGIEAIEKVEANRHYNVVLMDIHMPQMGGLEATKVIRSKEDPYFKRLPIIALTASMLTNQMDQIGDAGMNDYVLKPFDPKTLYDKLSRYQEQ